MSKNSQAVVVESNNKNKKSLSINYQSKKTAFMPVNNTEARHASNTEAVARVNPRIIIIAPKQCFKSKLLALQKN